MAFEISMNKVFGSLHDSAMENVGKKISAWVKQGEDAEGVLINTAINTSGSGSVFTLGKPGEFAIRLKASAFEGEDKAKELAAAYLQYFCVDSKITAGDLETRKVSGDKSGEMFEITVPFAIKEETWQKKSFEKDDEEGTPEVKESKNASTMVKAVIFGNAKKADESFAHLVSRKLENKIRKVVSKENTRVSSK